MCVVADNYLGTDQISFTLNFSKGASQIVAQYYQVSTPCPHCLIALEPRPKSSCWHMINFGTIDDRACEALPSSNSVNSMTRHVNMVLGCFK